MPATTPIVSLLLLLGLGFFFGLAYEEFYARLNQKRPGGVRTFPLLALTGSPAVSARSCASGAVERRAAGAERLAHLLLLAPPGRDRRRRVSQRRPDGADLQRAGFSAGAGGFAEPPWVAVGATVAAVLLLTARQSCTGSPAASRLAEIVNAGRFLLLTGFVLPLLPDKPVTDLTPITPHQVWLAVVAVCTVSYASYLLQRYVAPAGGGLLVALLGGLYSSTATTLVLAREARDEPSAVRQSEAGIVLATAVMYLRLVVIILVFNRDLALALVAAVAGVCRHLVWRWRWDGTGSAAGAARGAGTRDRRPIRWNWSPRRHLPRCSW